MLKLLWIKISSANKYIDEEEPWNLKQIDINRMNVVIYCLIESLRQIALLIQPFMPDTSIKILDSLSIKDGSRKLSDLKDRIRPQTLLNKPNQLFPRIHD